MSGQEDELLRSQCDSVPESQVLRIHYSSSLNGTVPISRDPNKRPISAQNDKYRDQSQEEVRPRVSHAAFYTILDECSCSILSFEPSRVGGHVGPQMATQTVTQHPREDHVPLTMQTTAVLIQSLI